MAAAPGSSLVSRGLDCQSDWLVATSSRQPWGRLGKTPQLGDEASGRHSVCVELALASWNHAPPLGRNTAPCEDGLQPRVLGSLASCRTHVMALARGRNFLGRGAVCTMQYPPDGGEEGNWEGGAMRGSPVVRERPPQRGAKVGDEEAGASLVRGMRVAGRTAPRLPGSTGHSERESPEPPACLGGAHTLPDLRVKTGPGGSRCESHVVLNPPVRQQRPDQMLGQTRQVPQSPPCWPGAEPPRGPADAGDTCKLDVGSEGRPGLVTPRGGPPRSPQSTLGLSLTPWPLAGGSLCITVGRLSPPPRAECEEGGVQPKEGTWPSSRPRHPIVTREQAPSPQMQMIRKGPAPALLVLMTHTSRGWTPRGRLNTEGKEA